MYVAAIDIGKLNMCFYIENVQNNDISSRKDILLWVNKDITTNCKVTKYVDPELFYNLTDLLNTYKTEWDKCDVILIEQQMSFGRNKINTLALKLAQHCFSYFQIMYGRSKTIIDFPSYHKTQLLNAPKHMTKPQRKKWTVTKLTEFLQHNPTDYETFSTYKKKDDLADTLCMVQAYKILQSQIKNSNIPISTTPVYTTDDLTSLKLVELKQKCRMYRIKQTGTKSELIKNLLTITTSDKQHKLYTLKQLNKCSIDKLSALCQNHNIKVDITKKNTKKDLIELLRVV